MDEHKPFKRFEIRWREPVGKPECPYLIRWVLVLFDRAIRLHHWLKGDDLRYYHDHGWDYAVLILRGGYWEYTPHPTLGTGFELAVWKGPGCFTRYKAEHQHKVSSGPNGCWSLLFTGKKRRDWGFWIPGRNRPLRPLRYFARYGHHPCD
jgi:hypothetical protein